MEDINVDYIDDFYKEYFAPKGEEDFEFPSELGYWHEFVFEQRYNPG